MDQDIAISEEELATRIEWFILNFPKYVFYYPVRNAYIGDYHINLRDALKQKGVDFFQFMRPFFSKNCHSKNINMQTKEEEEKGENEEEEEEEDDYVLIFNSPTSQVDFQNCVSIDTSIRDTNNKLLPIMHQNIKTGAIIVPNNQFIYENQDIYRRYVDFLKN